MVGSAAAETHTGVVSGVGLCSMLASARAFVDADAAAAHAE